MTHSSFKTGLRAFRVLGSGQIVSTVSNIVKMKFAAAILGPQGVGLIGIYSTLIQTAAVLAGLGSGTGSTRQVAAAYATGDPAAVGQVRRAVFWLSLILATTGSLVFLALSHPIARLVLGNDVHANDVAWLSIGVALSVILGSQAATLAGLHRVGDLARVDVATGVIGSALGILAVWLLRDQAPVVVVLIAPAVTVIVSYIFIARTERAKPAAPTVSQLVEAVLPILRIGAYAVYWGVVYQLGFLAVRALIQQRLGYNASGLYQAAWATGGAFSGFLMSSVASDFYPRIVGIIKDHSAATKLINEQIEMGLLISVPLGLCVLAFAPWVIRILYTPEFLPAVDILRWQIVGEILKLSYYPLGYALIALGSARVFAMNQTLGVAAFVLTASVGIPQLGLVAVGVAYLVMWCVYMPVPQLSLKHKIGFTWARPVLFQSGVAVVTLTAAAVAGDHSDVLGAVTGGLLAVVTGFWSIIRISDVVRAEGRLARLAVLGARLRSRFKHDHNG